ncbi:MAG: rhamnulokinase [Oscillospiraceae bacterium]|nr:rhamnulokinase [Oscillospiraceae bacterium]
MKKRVLAFDLGASSGRAVLAEYDGRNVTLREVHRFPNEPVSCGGHLYWDVLRLFHEIRRGLAKAAAAGGFDSIGIDTWGVDYGLLDRRGDLLGNPFHYRDPRTNGAAGRTAERIAPDALYALTGNQIMDINTAFQLCVQNETAPELLENAGCFLLMPDLLGYFLTGDISAEPTIAGTTQLFDPHTGGWSSEAIGALGLPEHLFPPVCETGSVKGMLRKEIAQELGIDPVPVIAVCGHDTQSAAAAIPAVGREPFAFISCGTWALFGTELDAPLINEHSAALSVSNEVGFGGTVTFLKNITGLWLLQETRRTLQQQGQPLGFAEMEALAASCEGGMRFIDTDAPAFGTPGDMPARIRSWCQESGQPAPADLADCLRCIYDSLACRFKDALSEIEACTGIRYRRLYLLGGGVKDALLCQLTADICGIPVLTGPAEATALGNAAVQLIAQGAFPDLAAARACIAGSVTVKEYTPDPRNAYIYENYQTIYKKESE